MTNILLADEINRTSGKTQSALLEVMEERACTVDGRTYPLPEPFAVIATQNPTGTVGTAALPVSQLDRFMIKLSMGYPDKAAMRSIMSDRSSSDPLADVKAVCTAEKLIEMQKKAKAVLLTTAFMTTSQTFATPQGIMKIFLWAYPQEVLWHFAG